MLWIITVIRGRTVAIAKSGRRRGYVTSIIEGKRRGRRLEVGTRRTGILNSLGKRSISVIVVGIVVTSIDRNMIKTREKRSLE